MYVRRLAPVLLLVAVIASGTFTAARLTGVVADPTGIPAPPANFQVLARHGASVTVAWQAPLAGPTVTGYVVEGGLSPGEVLGSLATNAATTVLSFEAPAGRLFLRVHAIGIDGRSAASNEIPLLTGVAAPPSAPADLLGLADGRSLTLSWRTTHTGGVATRLMLVVTGTHSGVLHLPQGESFTLPDVPDGSYTMHLVAANDTGASPASNTVTLDFPTACSAPPQPPEQFRAWRVADTLSIAWQPPSHGAAVTGYTVHVAGTYSLTFDTTARVVSAAVPGDDLIVSVTARNACGASAAAPTAPAWTVVTSDVDARRAHFEPIAGGVSYRAYWSTSRVELEAMPVGLPFVDTTASPAVLPLPAGPEPVYYRLAPRHGPVLGSPGPVALATSFTTVEYAGWGATVTPALFDVDGDGCLDMVGARGRCGAGLERHAMAPVGLEALAANDGKNRDSRFADFTGDGIIDIFTNVYTRADDTSVRSALHVGRADGTYVEDPGIRAMNIVGYGETVLAADFDNDGDLDIFVPQYNHLDDGGRNWLLINDGQGHFHDVAAAAGVALNLHHPPEGAQALDWNHDGWLDIHVASHLFVNNGNLTFTDIAPSLGMPVLFDEGLRLFDVDLDGDLDLVHHDTSITRLYRNGGGGFDGGTILAGALDYSDYGFGLNVCDVNGDGYEDLIVANMQRMLGAGLPTLLLNTGGTFRRTAFADARPTGNDLLSCADLDGSGLPDIVGRWWDPIPSVPTETPPQGGFRTYLSRGETSAMRLRIVDAAGRLNQQGRTVRIRPRAHQTLTMMRAVESGSGYMAQNGYDLLVATPWPGIYDVEVRFKDGWVTATAAPGAVLTIHEDGRVTTGLH